MRDRPSMFSLLHRCRSRRTSHNFNSLILCLPSGGMLFLPCLLKGGSVVLDGCSIMKKCAFVDKMINISMTWNSITIKVLGFYACRSSSWSQSWIRICMSSLLTMSLRLRWGIHPFVLHLIFQNNYKIIENLVTRTQVVAKIHSTHCDLIDARDQKFDASGCDLKSDIFNHLVELHHTCGGKDLSHLVHNLSGKFLL